MATHWHLLLREGFSASGCWPNEPCSNYSLLFFLFFLSDSTTKNKLTGEMASCKRIYYLHTLSIVFTVCKNPNMLKAIPVISPGGQQDFRTSYGVDEVPPDLLLPRSKSMPKREINLKK